MKNRRMLILVIAILVGIIAFVSIGTSYKSKKVIDILRKNEISFIEIYDDYINDISRYHVIDGDKGISEIYNVILSGNKNKTMQSVNDSPVNVDGKLTKIVLTDSSNEEVSLFTYQGNDGDYYIEKPYEGIYKISVQGYENLK